MPRRSQKRFSLRFKFSSLPLFVPLNSQIFSFYLFLKETINRRKKLNVDFHLFVTKKYHHHHKAWNKKIVLKSSSFGF